MGQSKLLALVITAALLFSNIACACASGDMSSEATTAHHHTTSQGDVENPPCPHQDCEGCGELLENCATADYGLAPIDRDARIQPSQKTNLDVPNLDGPDLDMAFLDTGQLKGVLPEHIGWTPLLTAVYLTEDTPIRRKDQLTE